MARLLEVFVTQIYRDELARGAGSKAIAEAARAARDIASADGAGRAWSKANDYPGYTSYASLNDLPERHPVFADLVGLIDRHVARFARTLELDLGGKRLALDSLWINVLEPGGHHAAHIHPHSVVSGTLYLAMPKDASAIKFEDPRLPMLMAAPPRKTSAREKNKTFVSLAPSAGTLLLWESWLRHEVPINHGRSERISLSFNYAWGADHSPTT